MRISDWSSDVCSSDLLDGLGFLDLHHHLAGGENLFGGLDDLGARLDIEAVVRADPFARAGLDEHAVAVDDEFARAFGGQADAIFVILDFPGGDRKSTRLNSSH